MHIRQASELVYWDATASLDQYNSPTFITSTCTPAGGIPLGVMITSGESEEVLVEAFTYLKAVLPPEAFYGRSERGPEVFLTDVCTAERAALKLVGRFDINTLHFSLLPSLVELATGQKKKKKKHCQRR